MAFFRAMTPRAKDMSADKFRDDPSSPPANPSGAPGRERERSGLFGALERLILAAQEGRKDAVEAELDAAFPSVADLVHRADDDG